MSLEQTLTQITNFIVNTPVKATLDLGGHCLAGYFLTQRYFPEVSKSKKTLLTFLGGLAPDLDYGTLGTIPHKTATHTLGFGALATFMVYGFNKEDWWKYLDGKTPAENIRNDFKRFFTSRYVKFAGLGAALHLAMDGFHSPEEKAMYCGVMGLTLALQLGINKKEDRYKPKDNFRMRPCFVVNSKNRRFFVLNNTEVETNYVSDLPFEEIPEYKIPEYVPGKIGLVKDYQKANTPVKRFVRRFINH